jgi:hypothetical protein
VHAEHVERAANGPATSIDVRAAGSMSNTSCGSLTATITASSS